MNKTQLVDVLAERLGDRRTAATAVDGLLETIVDVVRSGGSVTLTGFGVFEARARAARTARNPRTGEPVDVPATTVPAFRPGAGFRTAVGGAAPGARPAAASSATATAVLESESALFADAPAKPAKAGRAKDKGEKPAKAAKSKKDDKPKKGKKK